MLRGMVGQLAEPERHVSPPETVNTAPRDTAAASSPIRILLVEDDDGDALLVEELLAVSGAHVEIVRAQTLAEARRETLEEIDCVLLVSTSRTRTAWPRCTRSRPTARTCRFSCSRASTTRAAAFRPLPRELRTTSSRARSTGRAWRAPCA